MADPFAKPSQVAAEEGQVIVDGPDGTALSFTPEAAEKTAHRLAAGSAEAQEQSAPPQDDAA